jgi:omega-hydroxy-beta-dihydromenaquinone-9 sulfotransferase
LRLIYRGRFAFSPKLLYLLGLTTAVTTVQTFLRLAQSAIVRRFRRTDAPDPLFILGHWRTGTTWLHEMLILDRRHTYPTTYQCFLPCSFLLTSWAKPYLHWLLPERRLMDNMTVDWDKPQEDEFALALLGAPSTYNTLAFPNQDLADPHALALEKLSASDRARWERKFRGLIESLQVWDGRRLVLKSPPHTARIPTLLRMFPNAKFVHLVRNPYVVYLSTINLWQKLYHAQGLQVPLAQSMPKLEKIVLDLFVQLHESYEQSRSLIPAGQLVEMKYEDLVRDPKGELARVYSELNLGEFDRVLPEVEAYLAARAQYERNTWALDNATRQRIEHHWGPIIRQYGYQAPPN